ncbi:hypothetical protein [Terracidiphilus sp.]|jgi:peptidoglycan/LPS O-acetylase OafA/YrhL|uniref:hypothetical protein n=1 Tax=Terracidiphilus sp. TaxID=1964191 RepID=UPI003C249FF5
MTPIETVPQKNQDLAVRPELPATASSPKAQRIHALDFTKGALVLIMVLYHWINYFIGIQWKYYFYLRFLTPSFIFITGFLISHIYLSKYSAKDPSLWKRLVTRGLKLVAIFFVLNLARNLVVPLLGTGTVGQGFLSLANLFIVFVSGNLPTFGTKLVSFSILVPISYVLILSGLLIFPFRRYRRTFHIACLVLLASIATLEIFGYVSYNLEYVAIGMMGVLSGFMLIEMLNNVTRHLWILAVAYAGYAIAITVWNVSFPLLVAGVILNLLVLYVIGAYGNDTGLAKNEVILLGKYSLFGYISQVAILQALSAGFQRMHLGFAALPVSFLAALVLTIASVEAIDRARARFTSVNRLYKAVFA